MRDEPFDFGKYLTSAETPAVSLGFVPDDRAISGYLDEGAAKTLAKLFPVGPGKIIFVPFRRWWQVWKRRKPMELIARMVGITETADGLTVTFVGEG